MSDPETPAPTKEITPQGCLAVLVIAVSVIIIYSMATRDIGYSGRAPEPEAPPEPELELMVDPCEISRGYATITGRIKNAGDVTVHFVTLELRYEDRGGEVIDTGTTYAVGSEFLRPGESSRFQGMSQAPGVSRCTASVKGWRLVP